MADDRHIENRLLAISLAIYYNGNVSFLWEIWKFDPCKIETLEQIDTQFVSIDYFHEMNVCTKFGKNPFTWNFWAKG